jgi:MFS family permease
LPAILRLAEPGQLTFALLYGLESLTYAVMSAIVPVLALEFLGDPRDVSILYTFVGLWGIACAFVVPAVIRRLQPRATYLAGGLLTIGGVGLFALLSLPGLVGGLAFRVLGAVMLRVPLALFTMAYIRRKDFTRSEPLKLLFGALPWALGPFGGRYLYETVSPATAFLFSIAFGVVLTAYGRWLRLDDRRAALPRLTRRGTVAMVRRYLAQPRLRLAWLIAFGRHGWWAMFFVYMPMFMVTGGEGALAGALVLSCGNLMQLTSPFFGWLGRRLGLRPVLGGAFVLCGLSTLGAGLAGANPVLAAALLVLAAAGAAGLDALGDVPFLRAVHPHERPEMAGVFSTHWQMAGLVPPAIYSIVLSVFDLPAVFVVSGLSLLGFAGLTRYIPRRM